MGGKHRVSMTLEKSGHRPSDKGRRSSSSNLSFPKHTCEMFHAAKTDYKPLGVSNIYSIIEFLVAFLIATQRITAFYLTGSAWH